MVAEMEAAFVGAAASMAVQTEQKLWMFDSMAILESSASQRQTQCLKKATV